MLNIFCQIQNQNSIGGFKTSFNYDVFIHPNDLIITPIYFIIIVALGVLYSKQIYHHQPIRRYFMPGLIVKLIGAICVGLIYQFYYKGAGDTAVYYADGKVIGDAITHNSSLFFKIIFDTKGGTTDPNNIIPKVGFLQFFHDPSAFLIDKIVACIGLFTFQTYTTIALVMATISFFGAWSLYITFCKVYPNLYKQFAIAVLFIPSVFFWGSGILKDCVTFGCLGWFTYSAYNIFFLRKKILLSSLLFVVSGLLILQIKSYIILSFLPSLLLWVFLTYRKRIKSSFSRNLATPVMIVVMAIGGYLLAQRLGQDSGGYSVNNFVQKASVYQSWQGYLSENGASGYNLGIINPTPLGTLEKFPAAVNVTLFRPYFWEVHNPVIFLAAVESFIITIFTLRIILKVGLGRTIKYIISNPMVTFCVFFSLLFAFAVGFSAFNFGALVRYKIPCIPFYVSALFILNYITQNQKLTSSRFRNPNLIKKPLIKEI